MENMKFEVREMHNGQCMNKYQFNSVKEMTDFFKNECVVERTCNEYTYRPTYKVLKRGEE